MLSLFDQGPAAPCPAPFNMAAHVLGRAPNMGDKTALSVLYEDHSEDLSFAELEAAVRGTATGLRERARPGEMILMRLGNTPDFPIAYLGALAAGLVPIPTSSALTEVEVAAILRDLPVRLILRDAGVACPDDARICDVEPLRAMRSLPPAAYAMGDPDRLGYVIYTSGTSGVPRAVGHAHRAIWARGMMHQGWYGLSNEDRMCHAGAFNWTYTLGTGLMDPWTLGATALIPAPGTAPADLPRLIADHRATIFAAAPGVYRQMLRGVERLDAPALRHGLSAGEKLPRVTRAAWEAKSGTPVFEAYGMSECSTFISGCPAKPSAPGALGAPQPGRRVAIVDEAGAPVPIGTPGTIAVDRADPGLMLEYIGAPEDTAARMRGRWFLTGDEGAMDAHHQITYLGRADDMMNAGGYRVSPIEVEQVLAHAPGISGVAATDVAVKEGTRVIAAFYTAAAPLDETALRAYVEDKLARYKHPRLYVHVPDLPMGANGKLLRRRLRDSWKANR